MSILISDILKEVGWINRSLYQPNEQEEKKVEFDYKNTKEDISLNYLANQTLYPQQEPCVVLPRPYPKNMTLIV